MLDPRLGGELAAILGRDRFLTRPADLIVHGYDAALHTALPSAVAMPTSTEEVSAILRCASDSGTAVVTRGAATSLTGAAVLDRPGSLVVDLVLMDRILAVDAEDMTATVEAGVVTGDLQRAVEERGLFYPPDPATLKTCTIGGNIATNAGGPRGLKYGVTRNYVLALEVVGADGTVLHVGSRAIKNATGYALAQLFVGSEGTLGIYVEMPNSDRCCGSAGTYSFRRWDQSMAMLDDKIANAASTGAEIVVTANPGCLVQLELGFRRAGAQLPVRHVSQVLLEAYESGAGGKGDDSSAR